jgi:hypothetical protein
MRGNSKLLSLFSETLGRLSEEVSISFQCQNKRIEIKREKLYFNMRWDGLRIEFVWFFFLAFFFFIMGHTSSIDYPHKVVSFSLGGTIYIHFLLYRGYTIYIIKFFINLALIFVEEKLKDVY